MLLSFVLSWRVSEARIPSQTQLQTYEGHELLSIYFDLFVDAAGVVCHQLGLLGTDLYTVGCGRFVETLK